MFDFAVVIFGVRVVLLYISHMANHLHCRGRSPSNGNVRPEPLSCLGQFLYHSMGRSPQLLTTLITPFSQHRTYGFATSTLYLCV